MYKSNNSSKYIYIFTYIYNKKKTWRSLMHIPPIHNPGTQIKITRCRYHLYTLMYLYYVFCIHTHLQKHSARME